MFGARLKELSSIVNVGVVACTGTAGDDAKDLIEQVIGGGTAFVGLGPAPQRCEYVEGEGCVTADFVSFLKTERLSKAASAMRLHGVASGVDVWVILYRKLLA